VLENIPAGLFSWIKKPFLKWVFRDAYVSSHNRYIKHSKNLSYKPVTPNLQFMLHLENKYFHNQELPISELYLKLEKGHSISHITGYVTATNKNVQYQNPVDVSPGSETELSIVLLPQLPLKDITYSEGLFYMSYTDVWFSGAINYSNNTEEDFKVHWHSPMYSEFTNSEWDKKWNFVWNLDYLNSEKTNFRHRIVTNLAGPLAYLDSAPNYRRKTLLSIVRSYWAWFIVNGIAHPKITDFVFWLLVAFRAKKV
jgi:hypothetical protein